MRFFFWIFLFFSVLSHAQTERKLFSLKPAFGVSGCQIHGDGYRGYRKFGVFGGAAVNIAFKEKISVDLGFYFSQKGARHNPNPEKGDLNFYHVKLNYLEVPLLFRFQLNPMYFATIGPSLAYLLSASEYNQFGEVTNRAFNKFEPAVAVGLGRKVGEAFFVEVRMSNSLAPIRDYGLFQGNVYYPSTVNKLFKPGIYNNVLSFIVAYKINSQKKGGN
jgi:hypothetical protein